MCDAAHDNGGLPSLTHSHIAQPRMGGDSFHDDSLTRRPNMNIHAFSPLRALGPSLSVINPARRVCVLRGVWDLPYY